MSAAYVKLKLVPRCPPGIADGQRRDIEEGAIAMPRDPDTRPDNPDPARPAVVERLFADHRLALLQYLTRLLSSSEDAEEIVQETYIRLLKVEHLEQLDDQVRRFLFKIATNLARDRFRQRKARSHNAHVPYDLVEMIDPDDSPDEIADWDAGMQFIMLVLLDLPPRYRQVFLLHVTENMSYRTIAKHLDVSTKTVERDIAMVLELCQGRLRTLKPGREQIERI
jgi:RNA polymerase sigma-70 factor (ECF subfamily)